MRELLMAWKNLWRNKKRTVITVASVFFGVVFATIMSSLQDGTYSNMIKMSVKLSSGYIQIQHPEFNVNKSINNIFTLKESEFSRIKAIKGLKSISKRLESFALFSSDANTRGGSVIGIEPDKDKETSNIQNWISEGSFIEKGDRGVLLTYNTASNLKLGVNDTLVLISQGYHGVTAAAAYPIKGIIKFSTPQMNNLGAFMDINLAQEFFSTNDKISSAMIMVSDYKNVPDIAASIKKNNRRCLQRVGLERNKP
jgi:putative ABC transport system permease protein